MLGGLKALTTHPEWSSKSKAQQSLLAVDGDAKNPTTLTEQHNGKFLYLKEKMKHVASEALWSHQI